jgi:hypothetical protein
MTCKECKHWGDFKTWKPVTREAATEGRCSELQYRLEIDISAGWNGGVVNTIYTDHDFFCAYFERIENVTGG